MKENEDRKTKRKINPNTEWGRALLKPGADLKDVEIVNSCCKYCSVYKANLEGANLEGAISSLDYTDGNFENANMKNADFHDASIENGNFKNTNLENINLRNAYLFYTNFGGANLKGADLTKADVQQADFRNANLENANLELVRVWNSGKICEGSNNLLELEGIKYNKNTRYTENSPFYWHILDEKIANIKKKMPELKDILRYKQEFNKPYIPTEITRDVEYLELKDYRIVAAKKIRQIPFEHEMNWDFFMKQCTDRIQNKNHEYALIHYIGKDNKLKTQTTEKIHTTTLNLQNSITSEYPFIDIKRINDITVKLSWVNNKREKGHSYVLNLKEK
jgi:hypothetical protein|tara:strand:+ start:151 stop:1155 length:1005 start_codon:yes stop_codon:yes gene_type:complete